MGIAENLKRAAQFLGTKRRMQNNEDLDDINRTVSILFNGTHFVPFLYFTAVYYFGCYFD